MRPVLPILLLVALPTALAGQALSIDGGLTSLSTLVTDGAGGRERLDGVAATVDGRARLGRFILSGGLGEGRLQSPSDRLSYADGYISFGVAIVGGFELQVGPTARVFVRDGAVTRWVNWRAGGRYEVALSPRPLWLYLDGWAASGSRSGLGPNDGIASGGQVGVRWQRGPFGVGLDYASDEFRFAPGDRVAAERLTLRIGVSRAGRID